jgi:steroid delta-isomerase-like uncharacterized protein
MTRDETIRFFNLGQVDWRRRNIEGLADRHTSDGIILSPIFKTVKGRDAIRQSYQSLFAMFPDWSYEGQRLLVDGDHVAQPFIVRATHSSDFMGFPGTGKRFEIQGVRVMQMKDGLIEHEERHYDFTRFLVELGIIRIKPARTA